MNEKEEIIEMLLKGVLTPEQQARVIKEIVRSLNNQEKMNLYTRLIGNEEITWKQMKALGIAILNVNEQKLDKHDDVGEQGDNNDDSREHQTLELIVSNVMKELGMPAHIKGYYYGREAILMVVKEPEIISYVTKKLYPTVAKKFDTTPSRVERAIRHAIEVAWERGNIEAQERYFGYTVDSEKGKPTNSEFIAEIAEFIRLEYL